MLFRSLAQIDQQIAEGSDTNIVLAQSRDGSLRLVDLHLDSPDGTVVIDEATATILPGERVLVTGEAGAGSTTLFRAIAGLWPWGKGRIERPAAEIMFVPQRPYLPHGTLREALAFPRVGTAFDDAALTRALDRCELGALARRLDEVGQWDRILSESEQQKLSFARILLHRPAWVFMDQATSALSEEEQAAVMSLFESDLPQTSLVSAGFRSGLPKFHHRGLSLVRSPASGGTRLEQVRIAPRGATRPPAAWGR